VQRLVKAMIHLDPNLRDSADYYLKTWYTFSYQLVLFLAASALPLSIVMFISYNVTIGPRRCSLSTLPTYKMN
jgi:hypothetical protein